MQEIRGNFISKHIFNSTFRELFKKIIRLGEEKKPYTHALVFCFVALIHDMYFQ